MSDVSTTKNPAHSPDDTSIPARTSTRTVIGIAVGLSALLMVILTAFAYPATHVAANGIEVAIVGPEAAVQQISAGLGEKGGEGGFEVSTRSDRDAAVTAIQDREVHGAIVLGPEGGEMLTASAASPAVAQILAGVAAGIPAQVGGPLAVSDVVPLPASDPRGAALGSSLLPLVIGGIASGAILSLRVRGVGAQIMTAVATAAATGIGMALILSTWLDALPGSLVTIAGALALSICAISIFTIGLSQLIGPAGIGVAALL
ncbi:MAG: hypothetical protein WA880_13525, partial [Ornithinimicrobium sp.]